MKKILPLLMGLIPMVSGCALELHGSFRNTYNLPEQGGLFGRSAALLGDEAKTDKISQGMECNVYTPSFYLKNESSLGWFFKNKGEIDLYNAQKNFFSNVPDRGRNYAQKLFDAERIRLQEDLCPLNWEEKNDFNEFSQFFCHFEKEFELFHEKAQSENIKILLKEIIQKQKQSLRGYDLLIREKDPELYEASANLQMTLTRIQRQIFSFLMSTEANLILMGRCGFWRCDVVPLGTKKEMDRDFFWAIKFTVNSDEFKKDFRKNCFQTFSYNGFWKNYKDILVFFVSSFFFEKQQQLEELKTKTKYWGVRRLLNQILSRMDNLKRKANLSITPKVERQDHFFFQKFAINHE